MIREFADLGELSLAAAELFVASAREAVSRQGRCSVALAGGNTPRGCYQLLAKEPLREQVPWEGLHIFWGDERCVPPEDSRSNARMAREALLDAVPLPAVQVHPMACAADPEAAARDYQRLLSDHFAGALPRFDLLLLGLGEDGHTASLFPGSPALSETERWVVPVQKPGDPFRRLTLTLPLLNNAACCVFLVAGADKVAALRQVLTPDGQTPPLPAQSIAPRAGELVWLVDRAARES